MWKPRETLEADELRVLAPYAVFSQESLGRQEPEPQHPYRTPFQRDRARIIHSSAFRRLDGKTQVFLNGSGDHFRTRLTHTMEVASITRTIASALGLNEALAESIALAHDLGHSPFGHAGETELHRLMKTTGGFNHNAQSLRIVEILEQKYPNFPGLNLSYEVLEGLRKHDSQYQLPNREIHRHPSLEAQVANLADEITYYSHDLDDGLESGLLQPDKLDAVILWHEAKEVAQQKMPHLDPVRDRGYIIRCLINREVDDLVATSASRISEAQPTSVQAVRSHTSALIAFSPELHHKNQDLRSFLFRELYHHPTVTEVHARSCKLLAQAFAYYLQNPQQLGSKSLARMETQGLERTVCDYLASMTDRYLLRRVASKINDTVDIRAGVGC